MRACCTRRTGSTFLDPPFSLDEDFDVILVDEPALPEIEGAFRYRTSSGTVRRPRRKSTCATCSEGQ